MSSVGSPSSSGASSWSSTGGPLPKPVAPEIQQIRAELDQLRGTINQGRGPAGTVDVAGLQQRVAASGNPDLERELKTLVDQFSQTVQTHSSCAPATRLVPPTTLSRSAVQTVLRELAQARAEVAQADADGDGHLTYLEAKTSAAQGVSKELGIAATTGFGEDLGVWKEKLGDVKYGIEYRSIFDDRLQDAAQFHAETPAGRDALVAHFRDRLSSSHDPKSYAYDQELGKAEKSLLSRLFGSRDPLRHGKQGHLSDREVRSFLQTQDLSAYAKATTAATEQRLGGTYADMFLKGVDLQGAGQLQDPDFLNPDSSVHRSGCS